VRGRGDHGEASREQRSRTDSGDDLPDQQHQHPGSGRRPGTRRQDRDHLAHGEQERAANEQPLTAEQVTEHTEGQLKQADRQQERVGDPRQLRRSGTEILLEHAVQHGRDGEPDLRHQHRQRRGGERSAGEGLRPGGGSRGLLQRDF
jgi:hypothetical protein